MKNTVKNILKLSAAAGIGYYALGELLYQGIFNIRLTNGMVRALKLEDKEMMRIFYEEPVFVKSFQWFDGLGLKDRAIYENGKEYHGFFLRQNEKSHNWLICLHGYRGDRRAEAPFAEYYYEKGYNIAMPCMTGHEDDKGKYCTMGCFDKDVLTGFINHIVREDPDSRIILHGVSMGASTVMLALGENLPENVKFAVCDCGFDSSWDLIYTMLKENYKLPAKLILSAVNGASIRRSGADLRKSRPIDALRRSKTPVLFVQGAKDNLVPLNVFYRVYEACGAYKDMLISEKAVHAVSVAFSYNEYIKKLESFENKFAK